MKDKIDFVLEFGLTMERMKQEVLEACDKMKYKIGEEEYCKYGLMDFCNKYVYAYDYELEKKFGVPYLMSDGKVTMDYEAAKKVKLVSSFEFADDEDTETEEEEMSLFAKITEIKEKAKKEFADNEYKEAPAQEALNANESEQNEELVNESETNVNDAKVTLTKEQLDEMEAKIEKLEAEKKELEDFKAEVDKQRKDAKVEYALEKVKKVMPIEEIEKWKTEAEKYSLENLETWENGLGSCAFSYAENLINKEKVDEFKIAALPINKISENKKGLWD
jgi:hypothetical protein